MKKKVYYSPTLLVKEMEVDTLLAALSAHTSEDPYNGDAGVKAYDFVEDEEADENYPQALYLWKEKKDKDSF